ncbi:calcium and integrin-binding protein 1-like isoform X2 [Leptopilina boulardi]|uniref:calcium and integrin-binding protein 1-like isoform X2 n=1 Tax=Leptopilina boulardi TaxID=63433 RepID=UPI0021F60151|nr:calcium and integrin-binding protein 1-like isoform X2 [Leptopilina boulardi]
MGNSKSNFKELTPELLDEYTELTYLSKSEIVYIYKLFKQADSKNINNDINYRLSMENVLKIIPHLRHNPFRESIFRVFSSRKDGKMGFEDLLDLCSALSEKCPETVRSSWAFQIFDFDGDNQISLDDLIESVERLTGFENREAKIDRHSAELIAQLALDELDIVQCGCISQQEFIHNISRMPDFSHTFQFMP